MCYACVRQRPNGNMAKSRPNFRAVPLLALALLGGNSGFAIRAQEAPPPDVRCTLSVDTHRWQPGQPAIVTIVLANRAGAALELGAVPILNIVPKPGERRANAGSYWAPVDIVANRALDTDRQTLDGTKAVSIKPRPLKLHLDARGTSTFKIDANAVLWDMQVSSRWPAFSFSDAVQPGDYSVSLELGGDAGAVRCSQVDVQIDAAR
jgi:hypothetical protein